MKSSTYSFHYQSKANVTVNQWEHFRHWRVTAKTECCTNLITSMKSTRWAFSKLLFSEHGLSNTWKQDEFWSSLCSYCEKLKEIPSLKQFANVWHVIYQRIIEEWSRCCPHLHHTTTTTSPEMAFLPPVRDPYLEYTHHKEVSQPIPLGLLKDWNMPKIMLKKSILDLEGKRQCWNKAMCPFNQPVHWLSWITKYALNPSFLFVKSSSGYYIVYQVMIPLTILKNHCWSGSAF